MKFWTKLFCSSSKASPGRADKISAPYVAVETRFGIERLEVLAIESDRIESHMIYEQASSRPFRGRSVTLVFKNARFKGSASHQEIISASTSVGISFHGWLSGGMDINALQECGAYVTVVQDFVKACVEGSGQSCGEFGLIVN